VELLLGLLHRQPRRVQFDHRITPKRRRIDGAEEKLPVPRISPIATDQVVEISLRSVRFRDYLAVLLDQGRPGGLGGNEFAQGLSITKGANSSRSGSTNRRGARNPDRCARLKPSPASWPGCADPGAVLGTGNRPTAPFGP
jgi:hypothetical protein